MYSMATITHSDAAPAEAVHYSFAGVEFDLGGRTKKYETDDPVTISNAEAHPWLSVEYPAVELVQGAYVEQIAPKDDPMSYLNYHGNDPEVARAAEEAKAEERDNPVAVDAGADQTKVVETGPVAETLAADDTSKTADKDKG